ncbi:MAG: DUF1570 domain-containing protein, partial [Planctomycetota bacterium]
MRYFSTGSLVALVLVGWLTIDGPEGALDAAFDSGAAPTDLATLAADEAVVVLHDGTEVTGKIVKEDEDAVYVGSVFGTQKIPRSKIKEIRRGSNPLREQFEDRFAEATDRKSVASLVELGEWAGEKGLTVEAKRAFEKVVELDSENEKARTALGHAKHEGKWVDAKRVRELQGQGYELVGLELRKKSGGAAVPKPTGGSKPVRPGSTSVSKSAISVLGPFDADRFKSRDSERARIASSYLRKAERFAKRKADEHRGVSWSNRWEIDTKHYHILCNVGRTDKVARVYAWVMEDLYRALSTRIRGRDQHRYRSSVFIYKDQDEFIAETGMQRGVGGFFRRDTKEIRGYHGTFGPTGTTFAVLAHEGTHLFQALKLGNMGNMPQWLTEGMAVYFGDGSRLDPKKKKVITSLIPRDRLLHLQDKISRDEHTDLKTLVRIPYGQLGGSLYADAWSLCYFLFDGPDLDAGRNFIVRYWEGAKQRRLTYQDFVTLADKYYGGMEEMEKSWVAYTKSLVPEPVGKIRGDRIESYDYKFNWERPSSDWEWQTGKLDNNALVGLKVPGTEVEARL